MRFDFHSFQNRLFVTSNSKILPKRRSTAPRAHFSCCTFVASFIAVWILNCFGCTNSYFSHNGFFRCCLHFLTLGASGRSIERGIPAPLKKKLHPRFKHNSRLVSKDHFKKVDLCHTYDKNSEWLCRWPNIWWQLVCLVKASKFNTQTAITSRRLFDNFSIVWIVFECTVKLDWRSIPRVRWCGVCVNCFDRFLQ